MGNGVFIVGISGGSAAGKTMVANMLSKRLAEHGAGIIGVDRYFLDRSHLTPEERAAINYDIPEALDFGRLAADLAKLKSGESVKLPVYDYATHSSFQEAEVMAPAPLIIVEGILLFHPAVIRPYLDFRIFVEAERETRLKRRIARDAVERGRSEDSVIKQFNETVEPGFTRYTLPTRSEADAILDWNVKDDKSIDDLAEKLKKAFTLKFA